MKSKDKNKRKQLDDFFKWLNNYEELGYTEKGILFYVDEYLRRNPQLESES